MKTFFIVWLGQLASVIGSSLTGFSLGVYLYQQRGSATDYALSQFFAQLVFFFVTPFAGVLVDRWNRRWAMILSDSGAGICTLIIFSLLLMDRLSLPLIYLLVSLSSGFSAVQVIAYKAAVSQIIPKEHYGRAGGMVEMAGGISQIVAPVIAGFLMGVIHLKGIILIDVTTFSFALLTLLIVRIPKTKPSEIGLSSETSLLKSAFFGLGYVRKRPGLFILLIYFAISNFLTAVITVLATPMILAMSSPEMLGTLLTVCGFGVLAGSLLLSVWGGPKSLIKGIFFFQLLGGVAAIVVGASTSMVAIGLFGFIYFFCTPMVVGCSQAIWQRKIPQDIQGRVFSTRQLVAFSAMPVAYLISGPLADNLFEPMMATGTSLSGSLGMLIGTGPGRGIGLLFILFGSAFVVVTLLIWRNLNLRNVETDIPDADQLPAAVENDTSLQSP